MLQKSQYGARNDAWQALDDARSEVAYLLTPEAAGESPKELSQAVKSLANALSAYLELAPPAQIKAL
jgi:hypothetical protein